MSSLLASAVSAVSAVTGSTGSASGSGAGGSSSNSTSGSGGGKLPHDILDDIAPTNESGESIAASSTSPLSFSSPASNLTAEPAGRAPESFENPGPLSRDHRQEVINFKAGAAAKLAAAFDRIAESEGHASSSRHEDSSTTSNDVEAKEMKSDGYSAPSARDSSSPSSVTSSSVTSSALSSSTDSKSVTNTSGAAADGSEPGSASNSNGSSGGFWSFLPAFINKVRGRTKPNTPGSSNNGTSAPEDGTPCNANDQPPRSCPPTTPSKDRAGSSSPRNAVEKDWERDGRLLRENIADRQAARREAKFLKLLDSPAVDLKELRQLAWKGVPPSVRAATWQILLGYLPQNMERRAPALMRKRREYALYVQQDYYSPDRSRSQAEEELLDQIKKDIPRMVPKHPFFHLPAIQLLMERVLYIWAIRHPASGYVQGLNDVAVPLLTVFIEAATGHDIYSLNQIAGYILGRKAAPRPSASSYSLSAYASSAAAIEAVLAAANPRAETKAPEGTGAAITASREPEGDAEASSSSSGKAASPTSSTTSITESGSASDGTSSTTSTTSNSIAAQMEQLMNSILTPPALGGVEADTFWCLTALIDSIQDHYTFAQPGIQRMIFKLQDLTQRVDPELYDHLVNVNNLQFVQFAFRWINCIMMREMSLHLIIRLWDTCLADDKGSGFEDYYVYLLLALLRKWREPLLKLDFQGLVVFLQHLPTDGWTESDIEILTSEAYVFQSMYG